MITIRLFGNFLVSDELGREITPRGLRAKAIVALLAVAPRRTRTRDWLKAKLWSDRTEKLSSGSLRAALAEIRRAFGSNSKVIGADRISVWLDDRYIRIDALRPNTFCEATEAEPFADLDVPDPEFEHLIRDLRTHVLEVCSESEQSKNASKIFKCTPELRPLTERTVKTIIMISQSEGGLNAEMVAQTIIEQVRSGLQQYGEFYLLVFDRQSNSNLYNDGAGDFLTTRLLCVSTEHFVFSSVAIVAPEDGRQLWSDNAELPGGLSELRGDPAAYRLAYRIIDRLVDLSAGKTDAPRARTGELIHFAEARKRLFALDRVSLIEADQLFALAFEREPRGSYLAWRAFNRSLGKFIHHGARLFDDVISERELCDEALRCAPQSGIVRAVTSQLDYVQGGDLGTSLAMARQAFEVDRSTPLVSAILSNALSTSGQLDEGYAMGRRAVSLIAGSRHQYFFEHFACMAAAAQQEYRKALEHARIALRLKPDFVSTRRYEIALALELRDANGAARAVEAMRQAEPDFRISSMLADDYPVTTLRRLPLMDAVCRARD